MADLRVRVHFRLAISGRNLGSIQVCRTAAKYVRLNVSEVYDHIGVFINKYDLMLEELEDSTSPAAPASGGTLAGLYSVMLPISDEETLYVSLVRKPLGLHNIHSGPLAKGWRRWYNEFRVFSWRAQFRVPESHGVTREDPLHDGDCSEAEFYGVNIRDIAAIILQASAERFRETMADTRFPYRYRSQPGRELAIVRRAGPPFVM